MSGGFCRAAAFVLFGASPALVVGSDAAAQRRAYGQLVDRYRAGDANAVAELARWPAADVARVAAALECFHRPTCQAAALLRLEAAARTVRTSEGLAVQFEMVRTILSPPRQTPEATSQFAFSWHLAAGYLAQSASLHDLAFRFYSTALRMRPDDATALLARTTALEAGVMPDGYGGEFVARESMLTLLGFAPGRPRLYGEPPSSDRARALWTLAGKYRLVLERDASLHEARLRLGRILAERGEREQAVAELTRVLRESNDSFDLGLAHLCLGRLAPSPEAAAASFREATRIDPSLQQAWLGLSEASWRMGDRAAARAAVDRALAVRRGDRLGSWVEYHLGRGRQFGPALAALRQIVLGRR